MGPPAGVKILEIAGIGPGPFAAMVLADMGAEVLRVDRTQNVSPKPGEAPPGDLLNRGRRSVGVDLKNPDGVAALLRLVEQADALLEGFRPGVMERLGLGPVPHQAHPHHAVLGGCLAPVQMRQRLDQPQI